ncbi:uncharacterized protein LOC120015875 [Tripterygium wilfordii]|uniref:uncharacterized protein LOC120015875 n=1 Tax=Tripterygium wilfordii TaxID=458696 RepID=UPI0018F80191|nr:uncharacterized protein LOC120015875 [Tripterygium wilfordii]
MLIKWHLHGKQLMILPFLQLPEPTRVQHLQQLVFRMPFPMLICTRWYAFASFILRHFSVLIRIGEFHLRKRKKKKKKKTGMNWTVYCPIQKIPLYYAHTQPKIRLLLAIRNFRVAFSRIIFCLSVFYVYCCAVFAVLYD